MSLFILGILCILKLLAELTPLVLLSLLFVGIMNKRDKARAKAKRLQYVEMQIAKSRAIRY